MATVELSWNIVEADTSGNLLDVDGYNVYQVDPTLPVGDPNRLTLLTPDDMSVGTEEVIASFYGVEPGSYTYAVAAVEGDEEGSLREVSVSVDGVPTAVTNLAATAIYD